MGIDATRRLEVKTKDKTFSISSCAFTQTDYLVDQFIGKSKNQRVAHSIFIRFVVFRLTKARQNFDESSKRTFTYEDFSYNVVRLFFKQLQQLTRNEVSMLDALELMVFCNYEGQIDMGSDFETRLFDELQYQLLRRIKDSKQLCIIWMYFRSWGPSGWD